MPSSDGSSAVGPCGGMETCTGDGRRRRPPQLYAGAAHGYTMAGMDADDEAACEPHFDVLFGVPGRTLAP